jgi:hypothetical protein
MRIRLLFRFPESWRLLDLEYTNEDKTAIQVSRKLETVGSGIYK